MSVAEAVQERIESLGGENASKIVWGLAWPVVALNSLQVVNTLLDRGFIGHLDSSSLTGYAASNFVSFLMFSLAVSLATGPTALVSRAFGAARPDEYRLAAGESFRISFFVGLAVAAITAMIALPTANLSLPASDPGARMHMTAWVEAYAAGLPALFVIQGIAASLRGIGDTKSPMYISGVQILLHMTLNFLLIFPVRHLGPIPIPGANLGLTGGGVALAISSWISAIAYTLYLPRTPLGSPMPIRVPAWTWWARILRIASPAALMASLRVFSFLGFMVVLKQVTDASAAIAATSIGFAIESIMFMPAFGLGAAAAALVGQSLGMKNPDRAERLAWTSAHWGALVMACLAGPLFFGATPIASFLTGGKLDITTEAALLLRCLCATEFLFGYSGVLISAMQGAGDTVRPLWITVFTLWVIRVPLSICLALPVGFRLGGYIPVPLAVGLGAAGVWVALASSQALQGLLSMAVFKTGRWKTANV